MAKKRISKKDMRDLRTARSEIRRELRKNLSKKDMENLQKFKCAMKYHMHGHGCGGAIYGLGFIGALIYFVTTAPSIWVAILGVIKAVLWPAFLVYGALMALGM